MPTDAPWSCAFMRSQRLTYAPLTHALREPWIAFHEGSESHWERWTPSNPHGQSYDDWFTETADYAESSWAAGTSYRMAALLPDGSIAALMSLNNIVHRAFQNADAGWRVRADLEGRGYVREALNTLLSAAFLPAAQGGVGLHRVQAAIMPRNGRSIALAERVGFRREGLALRMVQIAGNWEDHFIYAKLADEHHPAATSS